MRLFRSRRTAKLNPLGLRKVQNRKKRDLPSKPLPPLKGWQRLNPKNWFRRPFHFTWKKFFIGLGIAFAVLFVGIAALFAFYVRDLPNPKTLDERPIQSTQILDRNGTLIYSFHGEENRTWVDGGAISDYVKKATIATEDQNFYNHAGFDLKGILRAIRNRFTHQGYAGGGSTITQQYIKNTLVGDANSISRKIKELILAIEVEQRYSKDEILTGYLNQIPYGSNSYGIEAAAHTYFNKSAKDLTLSEAATLAAIPQRPTYYSPYGSHLEELFARKDYVLERMVKVGFITQEEADAAKGAAPTLENPSFAQKSNLIAPHFVFFVRQALIDFIGGDPTEAEQALDESGYIVKTSLDLTTQNLAQGIVTDLGNSAVKKYQASNAALTAVDPKTGEILAMVGSIDYTASKSGNTNFAAASLQPGSSFKPFVYATAFDPDHKYSPASITYDLQTDFGGGYTPSNYDGKSRGPITNRNALAQSLNVPAVKNLYLVGASDAISTAHKLGITTLNEDPSKYGLSLVLGSGEVRPVDMANAYASFANGGMANTLRPILTIEKDGKVIKDFTTSEATKAIEPEVAFQISSILSDNSARAAVFGTKNNLTLSDRPVAAKSGTTQNNRDAWTVGYTPQISVSVWVGNNEPNKTMIKGADGSYVAAPIWKKFMTEYLKGKPVEQFAKPDSIKEFTVDMLSGKIPTDQSPPDQRVTDLFAPWQIPTENDDVHVKVRIDKTTGLLATSLTPASDIVEQYYFSVHSEVPDKPNWEQPVQAWAAAHGGSASPPTETDNLHTDANRPIISITSPSDGGTVSGSFTISTSVGGTQAVSKVEFYINNVLIGTATSSPWSVTYSADSLPPGSQIIEAVATNALGMTRSAQVTVTKPDSSSANSAPGPVSLDQSTGKALPGKKVTVSWHNPTDSDLKSVNVYTQDGTLVATVSALPSGTGSTLITAPTTIGSYTYYFRSTDTEGKQNTPGQAYILTVSLTP